MLTVNKIYDKSRLYAYLALCLLSIVFCLLIYETPDNNAPIRQEKNQTSSPSPLFLSYDIQSINLSPHILFYKEPMKDHNVDWVLEDFLKHEMSLTPIKFSATPNLGFTLGERFWGKVELSSQRSDNWFLQIQNSTVDEFNIYVIRNDKIENFTLGRQHSDQTEHKQSRFPTLPIDLKKEEIITIYFSVYSHNNLSIPILLYNQSALRAFEKLDSSLLGFYYGIMFCVLCFSILLLALLRDMTYFYYLSAVATLHILSFLNINGIITVLTPTASMWWKQDLLVWSVNMGMFVYILFSRNILCYESISIRYASWFNRLLILPSLSIISSLVLEYKYACMIANFMASSVAILVWILSIYIYLRGTKEAKYFLIAWSSGIVGALIFSFRTNGILPDTLLTRNAWQIGMAIEGLLLALVVGRRIQLERRARRDAQQQLLEQERHVRRVQTESLAKEKKLNEQLEQKVKDRSKDLTALLKKLQQHNIELTKLSVHDSLTQVHNRRFFDDSYPSLWDEAIQKKFDISLILIDVDHFKAINDQYGHLMGDECLKQLGTLLHKQIIHSNGFVARYGGEEFVVVLQGHNVFYAQTLAEKLRTMIAKMEITFCQQTITCTASLGIASVSPLLDQQSRDLIQHCDHALYEAKQKGRNQVVTFGHTLKALA